MRAACAGPVRRTPSAWGGGRGPSHILQGGIDESTELASLQRCRAGETVLTTGSLAVRPDTLYAKSGGVHIAYQTMGEGPIDVVVSTGWVTHLELAWDIPPLARFYERMAAFARRSEERRVGKECRL